MLERRAGAISVFSDPIKPLRWTTAIFGEVIRALCHCEPDRVDVERFWKIYALQTPMKAGVRFAF
ncbi:MAG: hypothetical protein ACLUE8_02850 [Lachnospiraceae bacterium]